MRFFFRAIFFLIFNIFPFFFAHQNFLTDAIFLKSHYDLRFLEKVSAFCAFSEKWVRFIEKDFMRFWATDDIMAVSDGNCWADSLSFRLDACNPDQNHELRFEAKDPFTAEIIKEIDLIQGRIKTLFKAQRNSWEWWIQMRLNYQTPWTWNIFEAIHFQIELAPKF